MVKFFIPLIIWASVVGYVWLCPYLFNKMESILNRKLNVYEDSATFISAFSLIVIWIMVIAYVFMLLDTFTRVD